MIAREHHHVRLLDRAGRTHALACGDPHAEVFEPADRTCGLGQRELTLACRLRDGLVGTVDVVEDLGVGRDDVAGLRNVAGCRRCGFGGRRWRICGCRCEHGCCRCDVRCRCRFLCCRRWCRFLLCLLSNGGGESGWEFSWEFDDAAGYDEQYAIADGCHGRVQCAQFVLECAAGGGRWDRSEPDLGADDHQIRGDVADRRTQLRRAVGAVDRRFPAVGGVDVGGEPVAEVIDQCGDIGRCRQLCGEIGGLDCRVPLVAASSMFLDSRDPLRIGGQCRPGRDVADLRVLGEQCLADPRFARPHAPEHQCAGAPRGHCRFRPRRPQTPAAWVRASGGAAWRG